MAYEIPGQVISLKCGDTALDKYTFVALGAGGLEYANVTKYCVGVLQRDAQPGEVVPVMTSGVSMLRVSAKVTPGQGVMNNGNNEAINDGANQRVHGIVLGGAEAHGLATVLICSTYRGA